MIALMPKPESEQGPTIICVAPDGPRRGLRREKAARYVGVSPSKFDGMVANGDLPKPWRFGGCVVWDMRKIDRALDSLDDDGASSQWDSVKW